jgi:formate-dependent phosphoribosylglycinamide formyltransferase (GAR transformylase)
VPLGRSVDGPDDAWAAVLEIGLPVVVKPKDGNQGKGVTVNVTTREQLVAGYHAATEFRDDILVERFYRVMISVCSSSATSWSPLHVATRRKWWAMANNRCVNWSNR